MNSRFALAWCALSASLWAAGCGGGGGGKDVLGGPGPPEFMAGTIDGASYRATRVASRVSAAGRLLRTILAGFAEYEREVISERIRAGISAARAHGKRWGGRKPGLRPTLTPARLHAIGALVAAGTSKTEIARQLGISRSTVYEGIELLSRQARETLSAIGG